MTEFKIKGKTITVYTANEFAELDLKEIEKLPSGIQYVPGNLTIVITGPYEYEVDLERCNNSAQLLDVIFQLENKAWMTPEMMSGFLRALEIACEDRFGNSIQGVFCPFGVGHKVNWATGKASKA